MPTPGIFDVVGQLAGCSKIVQIVVANYDENVDSSSNQYAPTGLTATITPTDAANKILVVVFQNGLRKNGDCYGALRLVEAVQAVVLAYIETAFGMTDASVAENNVGGSSLAFLNAPATTQPLTYFTEFNCSIFSGSGITSVQHNSATSSMLLVEVLP